MDNAPLHLYEELGLLALRDKKGTFATERIEFLVSGAVLAELLLEGFITVGASGEGRVAMVTGRGQDDPVLRECLAEIEASEQPLSLQEWVERLSEIEDLRHKVAKRLCEREILRADEKTVLLIFSRKVYPEVHHEYEQQILDHLRAALFADDADVDPRTAVLITLADAGDLLSEPFGRSELREVEDRIAKIANGQLVGRATLDAIAARETAEAAAIMIASIPMHEW